MKKIFFALLTFIMLLTGKVFAADDLEILSEEMFLTNDSSEQAANEETDEEKTGFFGFISNFFGSDDDNADTSAVKETFIEKSERLAEEGDLEAQMNLGYMYLYGANGVDVDYAKSAKYYEMAAAQDNPIAVNNLGSLYFNGIGVQKDIRKALSLFSQSAELGNENAATNLAFIYLTGNKKDPERNRRAVELFQKAQAKSYIAKFMLGYAYYKGFVVPVDYEKAFQLLQASASGEAQIDEAQLVLAKMYRHGYGTVQNYQRAIESYRSAVMQGNIEAITALAQVYMKGQICQRNLAMAHALLNIAAARNVPNAAEMRDELVKEGHMNLEILTQAQSIAQDYKPSASELTNYIRQSYGTKIRSYIDNNMSQTETDEL